MAVGLLQRRRDRVTALQFLTDFWRAEFAIFRLLVFLDLSSVRLSAVLDPTERPFERREYLLVVDERVILFLIFEVSNAFG